MEALGSVEYMFPLTASDTLRQVVFCDFGTVENNYDFDELPRVGRHRPAARRSRAIGPLPLAFDLGFPVAKAAGRQGQHLQLLDRGRATTGGTDSGPLVGQVLTCRSPMAG